MVSCRRVWAGVFASVHEQQLSSTGVLREHDGSRTIGQHPMTYV